MDSKPYWYTWKFNEADKAAKSPLEFEIAKFKIPSTDLKHFIGLYINSL